MPIGGVDELAQVRRKRNSVARRNPFELGERLGGH
jgi:hypothetical protein